MIFLFFFYKFFVHYLQSEYGGQIRTLMGYIDPKTDIVVAAGGDGTLFEVWKRRTVSTQHIHVLNR